MKTSYLFVILISMYCTLAHSQQTVEQRMDSLLDLSYEYNHKGLLLKGIQVASKALEEAIQRDDRVFQGKALNARGLNEMDSGLYIVALETHQEALSIRRSLNDTNKTISSLGKIGACYYYLGDQPKALEYCFEGLELSRLTANLSRESSMLNHISSSYTRMSLDSLARVYIQLQYNVDSLLGDSISMALALGNLGITYEFSDTGSMVSYMIKSLSALQRYKAPLIYQVSGAINLAKVLLYQGKIEKCIHLLSQYKKHITEVSNQSVVAEYWLIWAETNVESDRFEEAIYSGQIALDFASQSKDQYLLRRVHEVLANYHSRTGKHIQANDHLQQALTALRFSINPDAQNHVLEQQYQFEYKTKLFKDSVDLATAGRIEQLEAKAQVNEAKAQRNLTIGIGLGLLSLILFLFGRRMSKQKLDAQHREIEHQKELLIASVRGQEKERERLAKDLHDDVGAMLSTVKMNLAVIEKTGVDKGLDSGFTSNASKLLDETVESVRRVSKDLDPPGLKDHGLKEGLNLMIGHLRSAGTDIEFHYAENTPDIPKEKELIIFRIIQEMVNNSIKHAKTEMRSLRISNKENGILVECSDGGKGFDAVIARKNGGSGLWNMESRARSIGAEINFPVTKHSTNITLFVPNELNTHAA